ncbi:glycosyltransferase family 2 protein, partial [Candidatus Gottesmanbacteria bacterium]|nr:glycosyltransferase family 2 protein [Candidatus Gottesmanbacteria bacterium]
MHKKLNNLPSVSVIIPTYNEERHIEDCLSSLKKQTFKKYEIIVVDDGSTDSTPKIASSFNIKFISLQHKGPGNAKNYGAKIALGEILVFLDADMYVDEFYLDNIIKPIQQDKCVATYTTEEFVANNKNIWAQCWNINLELPPDKRISKKDKTLGLAFRAILKNKFLETGGYDSAWGYADDRSLSKYKIRPCPVTTANCYHYNPDSLKDIYLSSRWIGRSPEFKFNLDNLLKYSIVNSIRIGV